MQQSNAAGRVNLSTLQKIATTLQILAYAMPVYAVDKYINIGKFTTL